MSTEQREELDWNAFRYVAGEMTADEAKAFEGRLADEPDAREAVCRAVELGQLLAAAFVAQDQRAPLPRSYPPPGAKRAAHAIGWMMIGAVAASLAFWVFLWGKDRDEGGRTGQPLPQPPVKTEVVQPSPQDFDALIWTRLRAHGQWTAQAEPWQPESGSTLALGTSDLWRESSPPSWLLTPPSSNKGEKP